MRAAMVFMVIDPINGPIKSTASKSREKAWRRFIESPSFNPKWFDAAVRECTKDGFTVETCDSQA